jgi:hypothetical protein
MKEDDCKSAREDLIFFQILARWMFLGFELVSILLMVIIESPERTSLDIGGITCAPGISYCCQSPWVEQYPSHSCDSQVAFGGAIKKEKMGSFRE